MQRKPKQGESKMIVAQLMTRDVLTVTPETPLKEVAALLASRKITGLPVVADGRVVGVVSQADILFKEHGYVERRRFQLRRPGGTKAAAATAGEAMTSPAVTTTSRRHIDEVARLMTRVGVNRLPVVDSGKLVGIVSRADLVRAFTRSDEEIASEIYDDVLGRTFWLPSHELDVKVREGVVSLRGTLETRTLAGLLPRFVQAVPGVVRVDADVAWRVDDRARALQPAA
jgi:CBS domain-containing protein